MPSTVPPSNAIENESQHLVTVVITTSPTPSAPSTELISNVLESFRTHCPGLLACSVIVVFDAVEQIVSRARLKKGRVTAEEADSYGEYKQAVKELILKEYIQPGQDAESKMSISQDEAEYGSTRVVSTPFTVPFASTSIADKRVIFIEPQQRLGFALAVRSALRRVVTPYVWIQQHDWALVSPIPLRALLGVMAAAEGDNTSPVKYVAFPSVRMLRYAKSPHAVDFAALRGLTAALKQCPQHEGVAVPLTPLFFWHDKPHLALTAHYLARVFPSSLSVPRGAFIEDTVGHRARDQMKEGRWARWATWLYYPDEGTRLCLKHLQGRTWRGKEVEADMPAMWRERNREAAAAGRPVKRRARTGLALPPRNFDISRSPIVCSDTTYTELQASPAPNTSSL